MKRFRLNTIIIAMTLISVIGIMGVGYASWKENVLLSNSLTTGRAQVGFTQSSSFGALETTTVVYEPGEIELPFTLCNNGTIPMVIQSKSSNIEIDDITLKPDEIIVGRLIAEIPEDQYGTSTQQFEGTVHMTSPHNKWSQNVDIIATVHIDIPEPKEEAPLEDILPPSEQDEILPPTTVVAQLDDLNSIVTEESITIESEISPATTQEAPETHLPDENTDGDVDKVSETTVEEVNVDLEESESHDLDDSLVENEDTQDALVESEEEEEPPSTNDEE